MLTEREWLAAEIGRLLDGFHSSGLVLYEARRETVGYLVDLIAVEVERQARANLPKTLHAPGRKTAVRRHAQ